MSLVKDRQIENEIFRIMRNQLKGKSSSVVLKCWQMVTIAKVIYKRFGVLPYKIRLKHLIWYCDEELFWCRSSHTQYRYYLAIKGFSECREKWPQWKKQLLSRRPSPTNEMV